MQDRDRKPLDRTAKVDVRAGNHVARLVDVVPIRQELKDAHVNLWPPLDGQAHPESSSLAGGAESDRGRPAATPRLRRLPPLFQYTYQREVARPTTLLSAPSPRWLLNIRISRRCTSTPSSKPVLRSGPSGALAVRPDRCIGSLSKILSAPSALRLYPLAVRPAVVPR